MTVIRRFFVRSVRGVAIAASIMSMRIAVVLMRCYVIMSVAVMMRTIRNFSRRYLWSAGRRRGCCSAISLITCYVVVLSIRLGWPVIVLAFVASAINIIVIVLLVE